MAIELISTVTPVKNAEYPIVNANDVRGGYHSVDNIETMKSIPSARRVPGMFCYVVGGGLYQLKDDLITWQQFTVSGTGGLTSNGIYEGTNPPTEDMVDIKIWIDTSDRSIEETFSDITEEFSQVISNLINRIADLEYEVIKLNEILNSGWTPDEPIAPPTYDYVAINEGGNILINEEGIILSFEGKPTPPVETFEQLLVNENNYLLTNENNDIICLEEIVETYDAIIINEEGKILINENDNIICLEEIVETYDTIITNEKEEILINEDNNIICTEEIIETYDAVMTNEDKKILISDKNKILIK